MEFFVETIDRIWITQIQLANFNVFHFCDSRVRFPCVAGADNYGGPCIGKHTRGLQTKTCVATGHNRDLSSKINSSEGFFSSWSCAAPGWQRFLLSRHIRSPYPLPVDVITHSFIRCVESGLGYTGPEHLKAAIPVFIRFG